MTLRKFARFISLLLSFLPNLLWAGNLKFIPNKGQWAKHIVYQADIANGKIVLEKNAIVYNFLNREDLDRLHEKQSEKDTVRGHVVRVEFEGANASPQFVQELQSTEYYNYFLGKDPSKWASGLYAYSKIRINNIYDGIDLELLETAGTLKYNFIVHPGADHRKIRMRYRGATNIGIENGSLKIKTSVEDWSEPAPYIYQYKKGKPLPVNGAFSLRDSVVSFSIDPKNIQSGSDLIIDPKLVFATFAGSASDNFGYTATYDSLGHGYAGGTVFGPFFPVTPGAFQTIWGDGSGGDDHPEGDNARDAGILKFTPNGKALIYCTFLGGRDNEQPHSMVVNSRNELIVFGSTKSDNFPVSAAAVDIMHNGLYDIFVTRFSSDGKSMLSSTYLGGSGRDGTNGNIDNGYLNDPCPLAYNYGDVARGEVIVDAANNIYVVTSTESSDIVMNGGFQMNKGGGMQDGCIFKLNLTLSSILFSSYIGGNVFDAAYGVALGNSNDVYISGGTNSQSFPFSFSGLGKNYAGGLADAFVIRLNRNNGALLNSTLIGTNQYDQAYFVQVDKYGAPYIAGQTSGNWPVTLPIYNNPNSGQFIAKLRPDLSAIDRSMVFGGSTGSTEISPSAFLVDECERVFFSGWGGNTNAISLGGNGGNTRKMPITGNAQQVQTDGSDFYLAVFSKNLDTLLYGTFFGGVSSLRSAHEHVDGGTSRFDKHGVVYQSVCGGCQRTGDLFPTTPGAWSTNHPSSNCNNALFKIDFENLNQKPQIKDTFFKIVATDKFSFNYEAYDNDKYDSLFLELDGPYVTDFKNLPTPYPTISYTKLPQRVRLSFDWKTACSHLSGDTIRIKVKAFDNGCPKPDTTLATIKILVVPPPKVPVPGPICMKFNGNLVNMTWTTPPQGPYFGHYRLLRTDPNNKTTELGIFTDPAHNNYTDNPGKDPTLNNYCYTLEAYNICGVVSDDTYKICTQFEFLSPIDSSYMITATVPDNKNISILFTKSHEEDFESYRVYRSANRDLKLIEKVADIYNVNDTFFSDSKVNVQSTSYCYRIVVTDKCGHRSNLSNPGCNIVLSGISKPFQHELDWLDYMSWDKGVDNYQLYRHVDTGVFSPVVLLNSGSFDYTDINFDYDWGAYWYRVTAYENAGGFMATSTSNEVRLVQKPLLHVPNAFTPNDNGSNDVWGTVPVFVKGYEMKVFNRWGEKVFETNNKKEQWMGGYLHNQSSDNVFYWVVVFTGWDKSTHYRHGTVTILK